MRVSEEDYTYNLSYMDDFTAKTKKCPCKVLTLHGLLTRHVAHARARYRCRTAVHTASTLEVHNRTLRS